MFPDCSGSNYVSFVPAYSFALAYFSSGDLYVSACVLLSFLPFACQTAHLRFSRVACNLPLFPLACQVLPTLFSIFFHHPHAGFFHSAGGSSALYRTAALSMYSVRLAHQQMYRQPLHLRCTDNERHSKKADGSRFQ